MFKFSKIELYKLKYHNLGQKTAAKCVQQGLLSWVKIKDWLGEMDLLSLVLLTQTWFS